MKYLDDLFNVRMQEVDINIIGFVGNNLIIYYGTEMISIQEVKIKQKHMD